MFGSGNDGLGVAHSIAKMAESVRSITSPMDQLSSIVQLKTQFKGLDIATRHFSAMDKINSLYAPVDRIGRYLEMSNPLSGFDKLAGVFPPSPLHDLTQFWRDQVNATLPLSKLVEVNRLNVLASMPPSIIDRDFYQALSRTSALYETFSKFNDRPNSWKKVKRKAAGKAPDFGKVGDEDKAFATQALGNTVTSISNPKGTSGLLWEQLVSPVKHYFDSIDPLQIHRRRFAKFILELIVSAVVGYYVNIATSSDEKNDEQYYDLVNRIEALNCSVDSLREEHKHDDYRICISGTLLRENHAKRAKILAHLEIDDVVLCSEDSVSDDPKWIYVTYISDQQATVSGWALRARFRKE